MENQNITKLNECKGLIEFAKGKSSDIQPGGIFDYCPIEIEHNDNEVFCFAGKEFYKILIKMSKVLSPSEWLRKQWRKGRELKRFELYKEQKRVLQIS
jgi:hypothetical protein